jgi:hypothetical protein
MNASDLVLGCIADSYFKYLKSLSGLFTPPEYVELSGRAYTLGRSLGSGGAADVFVATTCSDSSTDSSSEQYALKKVCAARLHLPHVRLPSIQVMLGCTTVHNQASCTVRVTCARRHDASACRCFVPARKAGDRLLSSAI